MTGRRNGRPKQAFHCPGCRVVLAYVRPEWLVFKSLLMTNAARKHERSNGEVRIECQCGRTTTITWALLQL